MTLRRALLGLGVLVLLVAAYSAWRIWQVQQDLEAAQDDVDRFVEAAQTGDATERKDALASLRDHADQAESGTSGPTWSALTLVPAYGDDAEGIRALSASLDLVARGAEPLSDSLDEINTITADGRIDLETVQDLQRPVASASASFQAALEEVEGLDSSGYDDSLRGRFDEYVKRVTDAANDLEASDAAVQVLPRMAGAEERRTYLFVFQNNAEVRASGGLIGSWAEVVAEDGNVEITRQGAGSDFPFTQRPILPLTDEERQVYGRPLGQYFVDGSFTPDFPRAAEFMAAHYRDRFPRAKLDGIIALDPVSVSYLLRGTGPLRVGGTTLTADNAIEELLSAPYKELSPARQDAFFQAAARALFDGFTQNLESPGDFVQGLARAGREGRFFVAPFVKEDAQLLDGAAVLGRFSGDDGGTPHVDVAMNDATGAKMSYYLRYGAEVTSESCADGVQTLTGELTLRQVIDPAEARQLPESVRGTRKFGGIPGEQTVLAYVYGPYGGTMSNLAIDGSLEEVQDSYVIDGRPVYVLAMGLASTEETVVTWTMTTGEGQTGRGITSVTPGVEPGTLNSRFDSVC